MSVDGVLPLLPLPLVLLPGARMGLKLAERRWLDLLRDRGNGQPAFGVSLLLGAEPGARAPRPAAHGVEACIEDFDVGPDGVPVLRLRGGRRFHVEQTRVRDDGLVMAHVQWRPEDSDDELRPQHALLATVLEHIISQAGEDYAPARPALLDQAGWVGWRLAELLPLEAEQRLHLLQHDDVHERLDLLLDWIPSVTSDESW